MEDAFLRLVAALATCELNEPGTDNHQRWAEVLKAIYRLDHKPAHAFLASINLAGLPNESSASLLLRSHQMAKALLPQLLRDLQTKKSAPAETEHEKFVRRESNFDPFLEDANLTRDAFAGREPLNLKSLSGLMASAIVYAINEARRAEKLFSAPHFNGKGKHMTERADLEKLSNQEIRELWKQTTDRARKLQAEWQQNARPDEQAEEGYYRDQFGNIIEGAKLAPKTGGYFIDPRGFVQELAPGEKPPALSGNGLVGWLNRQDIAADPELKQALGDNLFFEGQVTIGESEVLLTGRLESNGWIVDAKSQDNPELNLGFRLSRSLTRDEAAEQAIKYVESKTGPQFKTLSENEERMLERMAVSNRLQAFVMFVQLRLPEPLVTQFLELGAAGDDLAIQEFASREEVSQSTSNPNGSCDLPERKTNPAIQEPRMARATRTTKTRLWIK